MKIFLKYILRCMTEKKGKLVLLILSIAISTGLFVTVSSSIKVVINAFEKPIKESYEQKDIKILPKDNEVFFKLDGMKEKGINNIDKSIFVDGRGDEEEPAYIAIYGKEDSSLEKYELLEGNYNDFSGNKCIISKRISEEKDLRLGDKINIHLMGENNELEVAAISKDNGIFCSDSKSQYSIIIPYKYISEKLNVQGKYNYVVAESTIDNIEEAIDDFNEENKEFEASKLYNLKAIMSQVDSLKSLLYIMLSIVVLMSSIIIYGSFKLTITERLSTIGTFLSQGATYRKIEKILILESICYGIFASVFGNLIGIVGQYLVNYFVSPLREFGIIEKFDANFEYCIYGCIFAVLLCVLSAIIPILNIKKMEIKDVILNNVNISIEVGYKKFFVGIILLAGCIVVNYSEFNLPKGSNMIVLIISVIALVLIYPKVVDMVSKVLFRIFKGKSRVVMFAVNNLRTSKVLMGNITLIIISLLCVFLITSLGNSIIEVVQGAYKEMNSDVEVNKFLGIDGIDSENVTDKIVAKLKENKDIDKDTIETLISTNAIVGDGDFSLTLFGIDTAKYKNYMEYLEFASGKNVSAYEELEKSTDDSIIISDKVLENLGYKVSDTINVEINGLSKKFKIIGSYDGKLFHMGVTAIMKEDTLKRNFNMKESTEIVFNTFKDASEVKKDLKENVLKDFGANATTKDEYMEMNRKGNAGLINVLSIFSYLAVFIAAIAVLNNIIIGFIQRKRELAILSSVGMSDVLRNRMLLFESISVVLWAFLFSVPYSIFGVSVISKIAGDIGMPIDIKLNTAVIPEYMAACLIIIVIASLPIVFKNKKLSIINELKYE